MIRWIAASALLMSAAPLWGNEPAEISNGNGLLDACNTKTDSFKQGECLGFIVGLSGGIGLTDTRWFCTPENSNLGQSRDIIIQYLQANPGERHQPAAALATIALAKTWPCPKAVAKP